MIEQFSLDFSGLLSYAVDFFNALFPVFLPILGIIFGVGLLMLVIGILRNVLKGLG